MSAGGAWSLAGFGESSSAALEHLRPLRDDEVALSHAPVLRLVVDGEHQALWRAMNRAEDALAYVQEDETSRDLVHWAELGDALKSWISHVRTYTDSTSRTLKNMYGDDSDAVSRFARAQNAVYDANFYYRLVCALRNRVEHRGVAGLKGLSDHSGTYAYLDRDAVLGDDPKFKASVRDEWNQHAPPKLLLSQVIRAATRGADYVVYANLVSLEPQWRPEAEAILGWHDEAIAAGFSGAGFYSLGEPEHPGQLHPTEIETRQNHIPARHGALEAIDRARAATNGPPEEFRPEDIP